MRFATGLLATVALLGLAALPGLAAAEQPAPPPQPYPAPPPYYAPHAPQPYPPPYYAPPPYSPYYAPPPPPSPYYPQQPQAQVPTGPSIIEDWKPGDPIPKGYRPESRVNMETIKASGAGLFMLWMLTTIVGMIGSEFEDEGAVDGDGIEPSDYTPLYVPVIGPFIAISTLKAEKGGLGLLLLTGGGQTLGALGLVLGIVDRDHYLVRQTTGVRVTPAVGQGYGGLQLTGHF